MSRGSRRAWLTRCLSSSLGGTLGSGLPGFMPPRVCGLAVAAVGLLSPLKVQAGRQAE